MGEPLRESAAARGALFTNRGLKDDEAKGKFDESEKIFLLAVGSVWGGASDECIEVSSRILHGASHGAEVEPVEPSWAVLRAAAFIFRAAWRMEHANNGTRCTPRRRFEQAQRRATAIAKHVDARAGASRSEEPAPVGDDGATVVAFAARFARRAVADAVAAR